MLTNPAICAADAGWKFAVDDESYAVSQKTCKVSRRFGPLQAQFSEKHNNGVSCVVQYELTGDPCGRQIWYKDEGSEGKAKHTHCVMQQQQRS